MSGNAYTTSTGKLAVAELTFAKNASNAGNTISTSDKDYDFSNATIVDTTEVGNEIDSISLLKDAIKEGAVNVSVIYNEENNTIAYAYVTSYTYFN